METTISAFPNAHFAGMTLLDYFATVAMQGIVTGINSSEPTRDGHHVDDIAEGAYRIGEAMMKEREARLVRKEDELKEAKEAHGKWKAGMD